MASCRDGSSAEARHMPLIAEILAAWLPLKALKCLMGAGVSFAALVAAWLDPHAADGRIGRLPATAICS